MNSVVPPAVGGGLKEKFLDSLVSGCWFTEEGDGGCGGVVCEDGAGESEV